PSVRSIVAFDRLMTVRDSRLLAVDWLIPQTTPGDSVYQSGSIYGRAVLPPSAKLLAVGYDDDRNLFLHDDDSPALPPDWIVVLDPPLKLYSLQPARLREILDKNYNLVQTFTTTTDPEPAAWFDTQDAFFVPYVDFRYRIRPGPDLSIYRRRTSAG